MTSLQEQLNEALASKPAEEIRNVCLIAHVDHGKTSYADSLVSSNAIISNRMAGKLRFMDSRDDEQTRGITMKSSGISLLYGPMLVNLMDSPGHVDFSGEVTSALLLSDIALLLVDVIEGVCSQTQALLRQAINNGQSVILGINKLDRLRVELKMSAEEGYTHIVRLVEAMNSCISQVLTGLVLEDESLGKMEDLEQQWHFDPTKGNVLFSSAIHGYAFTCEDFAEVYTEKLKMDKKELTNGMFGDYYLTPTGVKEGAAAKGRKSLFEQLVLEPLWALHDAGLINNDIAKLLQLSEKLGVPFKSRRVNDAFDEMMRSWMPVSRATFRACTPRAFSAKNAFQSPQRLKLLTGTRDSHPLRASISECSPSGMTVLYVVKFFRVIERKLAICRVLSGTLKTKDNLFILTKKHSDDLQETTVDSLWMLRGRDVLPIQTAAAGNIIAIEAQHIVQNTTLCSSPVSIGLDLGREMGEPLVRVSISPSDLDQVDALRDALKLLSLLDPSLRVLELETGELAMVTAGEVHLQKCIRDLEDLGFPDLEVSEPIVPFLETVCADPNATQADVLQQATECRLRGDALYLKLCAAPLPIEVVQLLEKSSEMLTRLRKATAEDEELAAFRQKLETLCVECLPLMKGTWWYKKSKEDIIDMITKIWSFGPDRARSNILFNNIADYNRRTIWSKSDELGVVRPFDGAILSGFELFMGSGPLCNENVRGVAIIVEEWTLTEDDAAIAGQLLSAMKAVCKVASEKLGLRLVAAMYRCVVATASQALGKVHDVLSKRKAKVVSEDINEATGLFEVTALLPVVESFSFCDHLRTNTSGLASAQLEFSHWEIIDEDPYWQPSTLEEVEEYGLKGDSPNHARGYMDAVRRRKGLPTEDLIVVSAEKQRNLKKNK